MSVTRLPVPRRGVDRDPDEAAALEESIARHPAGRRQRRPRPTTPVTPLESARGGAS